MDGCVIQFLKGNRRKIYYGFRNEHVCKFDG